MKNRLRRTVQLRETGFVVQPNLFWLGASPDGLIRDGTLLGLIEIKCPKTKCNMTPAEMMSDGRFYVGLKDDVPFLKKSHSNGYYSQIQIAMGLCQAEFCDFVVYTFKGMIVIRVPFDRDYFRSSVVKLSKFYMEHLLPKYYASTIDFSIN